MKPNERWVMTECSEWSLTMRLPRLPEGETAPAVSEGDSAREWVELREVGAPDSDAAVPSVDVRRKR